MGKDREEEMSERLLWPCDCQSVLLPDGRDPCHRLEATTTDDGVAVVAAAARDAADDGAWVNDDGHDPYPQHRVLLDKVDNSEDGDDDVGVVDTHGLVGVGRDSDAVQVLIHYHWLHPWTAMVEVVDSTWVDRVVANEDGIHDKEEDRTREHSTWQLQPPSCRHRHHLAACADDASVESNRRQRIPQGHST